MGARRGVGASLAAATIFSIVLVANAAILSGAEQHQLLATQGDAESYLAANSSALEATIALTLLDGLQVFLSARVLPCANVSAYLGTSVEGVAVNQRAGPVNGSGELEPGLNVTAEDDLAALYPFDGWRSGELNVLVEVMVAGSVESFGTSLGASQQYKLSLPVRLGMLSEICTGGLTAAEASLARLNAFDCNASAISHALAPAASEMEANAAEYGLGATLNYTLQPFPRCSVALLSEVSETGLEGPEGAFSVALEEEATLALQTGNATEPA